jgi:hypothetical protein
MFSEQRPFFIVSRKGNVVVLWPCNKSEQQQWVFSTDKFAQPIIKLAANQSSFLQLDLFIYIVLIA